MCARFGRRLVAICAAAVVGFSSHASAAPELYSPTTSLALGESFVTALALDSFLGLESLDVDFEFDAAVLSLVGAAMAPGTPVPFIAPSVEPGSGQTKLAVVYLQPVAAGSGPFLQATFKALLAAPAGTDIRARVSFNDGVPGATNLLRVTVVPEPHPAVLLLAGLGLMVIGAAKRATAATR